MGLIVGVATSIIWPWHRRSKLDAAKVQSYQYLHEDTVVTKRENLEYLDHNIIDQFSLVNFLKVLQKFLHK